MIAGSASRFLAALAAFFVMLAAAPAALAHSPSTAYLKIRGSAAKLDAELKLSLRDLEYVLAIDGDGDGLLRWGEVKAKRAEIEGYALSRLRVKRGGECRSGASELLIDNLTDGAYAVLRYGLECPGGEGGIEIDYQLFFELDARHRAFASIELAGQTHTPIFESARRSFSSAAAASSGAGQFGEFLYQGVWHIWEGYDHILFLLALLLPVVRGAGPDRASGEERDFYAVFLEVFKVVTAFTVAHSITLTLASLTILDLPSRLVESIIAASVVFAALNNLRVLVDESRWTLAFGFGLIHGFGFASVLADIGLPEGSILTPLLSFNLGVELGQLAIVVVFLPCVFMLRATWIYRRLILQGGSIAIAILAAIWLAERSLGMVIVG